MDSKESLPYDKLLTTSEVAQMLGLGEATILVWRRDKKVRIPFLRFGGMIRYRFSDVMTFINGGEYVTPKAKNH